MIGSVTRIRKVCPDCGSVRLRKAIRTQIYHCRVCDWSGDVPERKRVTSPRRSLLTSEQRIQSLREIHQEHPEWGRKELLKIETPWIVRLYQDEQEVLA